MRKWFEQVRMDSGNNYISSRIRLARNCADQCFPNRLNGQDSLRLVETMRSRLENIGTGEAWEKLCKLAGVDSAPDMKLP